MAHAQAMPQILAHTTEDMATHAADTDAQQHAGEISGSTHHQAYNTQHPLTNCPRSLEHIFQSARRVKQLILTKLRIKDTPNTTFETKHSTSKGEV